MFLSTNILNANLLAVGVTIAAICILGFMVFFNNAKSATGRAFLALSLATIAYSSVNYVSYQVTMPELILLFLRLTIFFAVWHAFSFFHFAYVFPRENVKYPHWYSFALVPFVSVVSLATLSPLVFSGIQTQAGNGAASQAVLGPAIPVFGIATLGLVLAAIILLIIKTVKASGIEKRQFFFVMGGAVITFLLLIIFNLIFPIVFQWVRYIPLAAIFFFPFIAFTTYAILKHHLLSLKVISTEILAFILTVVTFSEVIFSRSWTEIFFRAGELVLILGVSVLLIKSVLREVRQREELQKLNEQIAAQNTQLQDLSRFKSELLSLASHQIRSPLAAIKGFASLIIGGSYGETNDKEKDALKKIQGSADDLLGLINTLLDVRKVEEGKMEYKFERVDVADMITKMIDLLQPLATTKQLTLSFECERKPVWVSADPEKFKQVVQNLIDNAIKYTPSGFVKVSLGGKDDKATIAVADSGLGIPTDLIPHLFEEFVRDERVKKEIRGTGLGLYIARKIVEAHGGTIRAESPGEGKGSTFYVTIPEVAE